jgi:hypothetical protein
MHIFSYFLVVGSVLFSVIYFAENIFGPPEKIPFTTEFAGLPKRYAPKDAIQILTVRELPTSDLNTSLPVPEANARVDKVPVTPRKKVKSARDREPTISIAQTPERERFW